MKQELNRKRTGRKQEFKKSFCTNSGCTNSVIEKGEECKICYEESFPELRLK